MYRRRAMRRALVKIAVLPERGHEVVETGLDPSPPAESTPPARRAEGPSPHERRAKKLNANQRTLVETLAAAGGRVHVETLRGLDVPRTTLGTLVRRGLIELVDEPQDFTTPKLKPRPVSV